MLPTRIAVAQPGYIKWAHTERAQGGGVVTLQRAQLCVERARAHLCVSSNPASSVCVFTSVRAYLRQRSLKPQQLKVQERDACAVAQRSTCWRGY